VANAQALEASEPGGVAQRFLTPARPGGPSLQPSLEAQLCNLADEIAYNAHDIDDGVRSGLITLEQLREVELFESFRQQALAQHPTLRNEAQGRRLLYDTIRRMLSAQVYDLIAATQDALARAAPGDANEARMAGPLLRFSAEMRHQSGALKRFLYQNLYRHPQVVQTTGQAKQVVRDLFALFLNHPQSLQAGFAARARRLHAGDNAGVARVVADYIAGMTDRFAAHEHQRLTGKVFLEMQP
jgi:dGTPase